MRRTFLTLPITLAALAFAFDASASKVPFETTGFITGQKGIHKNLNIKTDGDYQATLSDLSFGGLKFDYLNMSISTAKTNLGTLEGPGTLSLKLTPGHYFLNIFGVGGGIYHTGLYGVSVTSAPIISSLPVTTGTPVPVPAAGWLLLSGLTVLGWKTRKQ